MLDGSITSADLADQVEFTHVDVSGSIAVTGSFYMTGGELILEDVNKIEITGSLAVTGGFSLSSGSNAPMGVLTLNGSNSVTVTNSLVDSTSMIFLTKQTAAYSSGIASVSSKTLGSFTVVSNTAGDADTVSYLIINPT